MKYVKEDTQNWLTTLSQSNSTIKEFVEMLNTNGQCEDLSRFFEECMNPTKFTSNKATKKYVDHLKVIEDARIYVKDYRK